MHAVYTGPPLCCASRSISSFIACFVCCTCVCCCCTPAWSACMSRPPGLRAVHPALAQSSPTVHPRCAHHPAHLPARPPASYVACVCVCVQLLRTLAWSACLPHPPGLRAVHPALGQSSSTVHARCAHHPARLPARPPASYVACVCVMLLRTPAWSACMSRPPGLRAVHPALVQSSCAVHPRCSHHPAHAACRPPASFVCMCVCCCCARPPGLPAVLTRLACVPCIQHWSRAHALCTPGAPITLPACAAHVL